MGMHHIVFTGAQQEAIRQAYARLAASPRAGSLLQAELRHLADPNGPMSIQAGGSRRAERAL